MSSDRRVLSGSGAVGPIEGLGDYPLLDPRAPNHLVAVTTLLSAGMLWLAGRESGV